MTAPRSAKLTSPAENALSLYKADFSSIYTSADPRAYYRTLHELDYRIPSSGLPVLTAVLGGIEGSSQPPTVLDLCCSYGVASAALHSAADPEAAALRYVSASPELTSAELAALDRAHFAADKPEVRMVGLDSSRAAIEYALAAGLLADGWSEDLERDDPSPALVSGMADVDVIYCTGGVGYIGVPTFARLLASSVDPTQLWLVTFVLRTCDFTPVRVLLERCGLITECLPGTFAQRRFVDESEQAGAIRDVLGRGLDPSGREAAGWFHAHCFVSRPVGTALPPALVTAATDP